MDGLLKGVTDLLRHPKGRQHIDLHRLQAVRAAQPHLVFTVRRIVLRGLFTRAHRLIAGRENGLTAGITVLVAFTVYFATSLFIRPLEWKSPRP